MSVDQVGIVGPIFGVEDESWGYVQTQGENFESEETMLMDGDGDIVAAAFHGKKGEITLEAVIKVPASAPTHADIGTAFSIVSSSFVFYPRTVEKTKSNSGWVSLRMAGSIFPEFAGVTSTTTTTT